jgi:hypothetical protein
MSETMAIEERLRRFAASPDDQDWKDVLRRAGLAPAHRRARARWTRRRLVVAVVVVAALTVAAVAVADRSLLGISNHGKRVHPGAFVVHELHWHAGIFKKAGLPAPDTAKPGTFRQMALRQGIGVYIARSKKNDALCFYEGRRQSIAGQPPKRLYLSGPGCDPVSGGNFALPDRLTHGFGRKAEAKQEAWLKAHPFPSSGRPIMDMSGIGEARTPWPKGVTPKPTPLSVPQWPKGLGRKGPIYSKKGPYSRARNIPTWEWPSIGPIVGVAVNRVRVVQVLALSDCHVVATVPVINNVYIDAHPPLIADAFIVARDADGKVLWHSWPLENHFVHIPSERKSAPRNCGLR